MLRPTEQELLQIIEASAVDRAFGFLYSAGLGFREERLGQALARTLVLVLFPFAREEFRRPRRSCREVAEFVDNAILMAVKETLDHHF